MLKMRNFSESHLGTKARMDVARESEPRPPLPAVVSNGTVPSIVRTAPTMDDGGPQVEPERKLRPSLFQRTMSRGRDTAEKSKEPRRSADQQRGGKAKESLRWRKMQGRSTGLEDLAN
ncbi:hypothetical protein LTR53_019774, partial [Teratosphaeriaceae sp. CCFEE 6253]